MITKVINNYRMFNKNLTITYQTILDMYNGTKHSYLFFNLTQKCFYIIFI